MFIWCTSRSPSSQELIAGIQGRILDAKTEIEIMAECCLLPRFLWLAQLRFSYNPYPLPMDSPIHSGLYTTI